jgi:hypothetical protein
MIADLTSAHIGWLLFLCMFCGACSQKSDCEKACLRLARCKLEASQGQAILGERAPPPDAACMAKCEDHPDVFATCEGRKRECNDLLACSGALR